MTLDGGRSFNFVAQARMVLALIGLAIIGGTAYLAGPLILRTVVYGYSIFVFDNIHYDEDAASTRKILHRYREKLVAVDDIPTEYGRGLVVLSCQNTSFRLFEYQLVYEWNVIYVAYDDEDKVCAKVDQFE